MAIVYDKLMALQIAPAEQVYEAKDCMLYALGIGLGHDPMNEDELAFVYEKDLKVLPTMATVLAHSGSLARNPDSGINWVMVVNGEQGFTLHRPLAAHGTLIGRTRIVDVIDKGGAEELLYPREVAGADDLDGLACLCCVVVFSSGHVLSIYDKNVVMCGLWREGQRSLRAGSLRFSPR